jgi:prepilin-type N-terminal cleavage/methylation domain-containing protein
VAASNAVKSGRNAEVGIVSARRAFTLIELLVVLAIISLLISIVAPTMGAARKNAERTGCAANLREVGLALRSYLDNNEDKLPWASWVPSSGPFPVEGKVPIYISKVLQKDTAGQSQIFKCPGDKAGNTTCNERPHPNTGKTFFETEASSYEFRWRAGGQTMKEYVDDMQHRWGTVPQNSVWLFRDFDNFHGSAGTKGSRRYLYIDGHVTDHELY